MGIQFFETVMGQRFYNAVVPSFIRQFEHFTASLDRIEKHLAKLAEPVKPAEPAEPAEPADAIELLARIDAHLRSSGAVRESSFDCDNDSGEVIVTLKNGMSFVLKARPEQE